MFKMSARQAFFPVKLNTGQLKVLAQSSEIQGSRNVIV